MIRNHQTYTTPLYGIKAVEEIQQEGEMELEASIDGDYTGINNWLNTAKEFVSSAESTTNEIKSIVETATAIGQTVYTAGKAVTDSVKKQQIEEYLTNLRSLVKATESRLKQIRKEKWLLFGKVSAGCVAVGTFAYLTLKK